MPSHIDDFNTFINTTQLVEIPMGGRKFTRVSDDGLKFSKLDRFLVTEGFKSKWGNLAVVALDRKLSDHVPIVLKDLDVDFGPKPFHVFDIWLKEVDIEEEKEIWDAINSCGGDKAPGPDGFNFKFIKRFWEIFKSEIVNSIRWFWDRKEISRGCNSSFVALIPKVTDPIGLGEYRPISLIGCYYKSIAKLLAERLKKVIGKLVGDAQNAFIGGRYILDGILIANETVEFLKRKKTSGLIFKVDFEKAYDSINWKYLCDILKSMGFGDKWCAWIGACLQSSSMSVLVNGSPTAEFNLERGIRQGDPLSPFLFILAAEGLNAMVNEAVDRGVFKGIKVGTDNVVVSHLQYADDTIFFGEWDKDNAKNLMCILNCFEKVSGLKVNLNKSRLYGVGVNSDEVVNMARWMQCSVGEFPFTYLGLPIGKCMRRESAWRGVVEKFKKRLCEWKAKTMSFGGRLTLVKSVLGSLPLYYFSMFRVPLCVTKKLERIRKDFFWGGVGENKKLAWIKWDKVLASHGAGGLNIGSLRAKNLALVGKWWWRFRIESGALWVRVIKNIYGINGGLVDNGVLRELGGSSVWRDIVRVGIDLDKIGVGFSTSFSNKVGNGGDTSFWEDRWLGNVRLCDKFPRLYHIDRGKEARVIDRGNWSEGIWKWEWDWVREPRGRACGDLAVLMDLLHTVNLTRDCRDSWHWNLAEDGKFKVKDLSLMVDDLCLVVGANQETVWNKIVPKKVNIFIWRALNGRIPVRVELNNRGIDLDSVLCPCCGDNVETYDHILVNCNVAMSVWEKIFNWWRKGAVNAFSVSDMLQHGRSDSNSTSGSLWQIVTWVTAYMIWKERNSRVFSAKVASINKIVQEIQLKSFDWISRRSKKVAFSWQNWFIDPSSCKVSN
ncbi:reverse transcriptase domain, Reverse transcriptase zinc-binding domain protein [Artemisia annua]|uniref:Reverse transcriptase domain, Reverse transcriptase zinc-binding domain protein n=1 Tax=Artemisia annua TaxID=35608 RepID=A0A2U1P3B3_ARTAN|nr:reverse transcriptase domain, Reverse transcriptase zinc-binding domain protein [Artemisia annua]